MEATIRAAGLVLLCAGCAGQGSPEGTWRGTWVVAADYDGFTPVDCVERTAVISLEESGAYRWEQEEVLLEEDYPCEGQETVTAVHEGTWQLATQDDTGWTDLVLAVEHGVYLVQGPTGDQTLVDPSTGTSVYWVGWGDDEDGRWLWLRGLGILREKGKKK